MLRWRPVLLLAASVALLWWAGAGVLIFVVGVFVMILAHEAGHFVSARAFGIKVEEFFLGFGPRVWSVRRGETEYGVKAIPAGGYVRIAGMNPFQEPSPEEFPRTFGAKPAWQRGIVLAAGSATHFLLAFLALTAFFAVIGVPRAQVGQVQPIVDGRTSPAFEAGLRPGDEILEVDGREVGYADFLAHTRSRPGQEITIVVARDGERATVRATPVLSELDGERVGRLGIVLRAGGTVRSGPIGAVVQGGGQVGRMTVESVRALGRIFSPEGLARIAQVLTGERPRQLDDVTSIVGAARLSGQAVAAGEAGAILFLFAAFNVFVGIFNVLPLPPLDGGHLAVLAIERVTGRSIDLRRLIPISAAVAGFLIMLMLSAVYLDLVRPLPNPFQ